MENEKRIEMVLDQLRQNGYRITAQRITLIGIILDNECSSCKDIYYKAIKEDPTIGIATVYRSIKILEDLGIINRNNLYNIAYEKLKLPKDNQTLFVNEKDGEVISISHGEWFNLLEKELKLKGILTNQNITVVVKASEPINKEGDSNDQLYYSCECDNVRCGYNRKRSSAS
ncbi:MAG TPA: transcriptional repressor [Lachnospiraceae bacterium]|nr:transcriptional repressor [Lachnospiraceae bacterium]HEX3076378.1 transcriptional repressor [Lachnospiraceae bacterium]